MKKDKTTVRFFSLAAAAALGSLFCTVCPAQQGGEEDPFAPQLEDEQAFAPDDSPIAIFFEGNSLEAAGEWEKAIAAYDRLLRIDPEAWDAHTRLAELHFDAKHYSRAIEHGKAALNGSPGSEDVLNTLARSYIATGRVAEAIDEFEKLVKNDPERSDVHYFLSVLYGSAERPGESLRSLELAVEKGPENAFFHLALAERYWSMGELGAAEREYLAARKYTDRDDKIIVALARLYSASNRWEEAARSWEELIDRDIRPNESRRRLIRIYIDTNKLDKALPLAIQLKELEPLDRENRLNLADLYLAANQIDQALYELAVLWKGEPGDLRIAYRMVDISLSRERHNEAVATLQRILEVNKEDLWAWTRLAYSFDRLDDAKRSSLALRAAQRIDPENKTAFALMGDAYASTGMDEKALEYFNMSYNLGGRSPGFLFQKGVLEERTGRLDQSIRTLRELISNDPDHASGLNFLGYLFAEEGIHLDEAEELVYRALQLEPGNPFFLDSLGWIYYRRGEYERAVIELERSAALRERDSVIHEHLGDAYAAAGRNDDAREVYRNLLEKEPENEPLRRKLDELQGKP